MSDPDVLHRFGLAQAAESATALGDRARNLTNMAKEIIFILSSLDYTKYSFRRCEIHTQAVEDYLKAIYEIQHFQGKVTTSVLADQLGVAPASVTSMIKKLANMRLVVYQPYQGVELTKAGQKTALEIIRHHRLIELFLAETLDVPWDQVHAEAHRIEHVLSEDLEDRMDALLGHPTTDPHGALIPARDGSMDQQDTVRLADLETGQLAVVTEVSDHDPALLRYLGELGLYPGAEVRVVAIAPFDGPLTIRVDEAEYAIGHEVAGHISMTEIKTNMAQHGTDKE